MGRDDAVVAPAKHQYPRVLIVLSLCNSCWCARKMGYQAGPVNTDSFEKRVACNPWSESVPLGFNSHWTTPIFEQSTVVLRDIDPAYVRHHAASVAVLGIFVLSS